MSESNYEGWPVIDCMGRTVGKFENGSITFSDELLLTSPAEPPEHRCKIKCGDSVAAAWLSENGDVCYRTTRIIESERRFVTNTGRLCPDTFLALVSAMAGFILHNDNDTPIHCLDEHGDGVVQGGDHETD